MDNKESIINIPIKLCKEYQAELLPSDLCELEDSIKKIGLVQPVVARRRLSDGFYEVIVGRNRLRSARCVGLQTIPAIIRDLTDDEAKVIILETNIHRCVKNTALKSEIAEMVYEYHIAIRRQGLRTDLINEVLCNLEILETKRIEYEKYHYNSAERIGELFNMSARSISRYIRVHYLCKELKSLLDNDKLSLRASVEISYISKGKQKYIAGKVKELNIDLSYQVSLVLREHERRGTLDKNMIDYLLKKPQKNQTLNSIYKKYGLHNYSRDFVYSIIDTALAYYFSKFGDEIKLKL